VHSGSLEVLQALLCAPPFFAGRGVFSSAQKQQSLRKCSHAAGRGRGRGTRKETAQRPYEWFKAGGVYNSVTGEEVAVVHGMQTGSGAASYPPAKEEGRGSQGNKKLTLLDVAQVSSFNAYISPSPYDDEEATSRTKVDYDIVVPWLVRNVYKRSFDMGKKLGASAIDVLEEMIEMVNPDKGRVLILPEIRELLRYLGIVVTTDVIKELCNIYPATLDLVEEKYQNYHDNEEEMLLSDSKSFRSNFPNCDKNSQKDSSKSSESKHDSDSKGASDDSRLAGSKSCKASTSDSSTKAEREENTVTPKKSLFDPNSEEVSYGLALDLFLDDIASGRGMKSIFSETVLLSDEGAMAKEEGGAEGDVGDENTRGIGSSVHKVPVDSDDFRMPAVVSVANVQQYRKLLLNCRDGAGNTALIVAAALGNKYN
jgi:hypothetical protein